MPFLAYSSLFLFLLLQACNFGQDTGNSPPEPDTLENARTGMDPRDDTGRFHEVKDDRIAGSVKPVAHTYRDPVTGTAYQINPNWSIVQRRPRTASEALLSGTNGLVQTYTDWSGQVETRIYECVSPTKAWIQNSIGCQVEPGFILVGGGAWADYGDGAGAFIWESRPLDDALSTWVASSKDHVKYCPHYLHAYAIGMRLKDNFGNYIPKQTLIGAFIKFATKTTSPAARYNSDGITLLDWGPGNGYPWATNFGGGARANWTSTGAFLTEMGVGTTEWGATSVVQGISKDHYVIDYHTMTLYAIGMKPKEPYSKVSAAIPNFGHLQMGSKRTDGPWVSTGVSVAMLDADPGYVITGMGGQGRSSSGPGRLLIGTKPSGTYTGQVAVYSKDHKVLSPGVSAAFFSQVRKLP